MNNYKVSISATPGWQDYALCSLDISIGNERETGEKLKAALEWIGKRFEHCIINLGDSLFRHSLAERVYNIDLAMQKAVELGDGWLADNKDALSQLPIPYTVTRWNEWLKHSDFENMQGLVWGEYFQSPSFRRAVQQDVDAFISRNEAKGKSFGSADKTNCLFYIMEEIAVHSIMSKEFRFARIYTASRLHAAWYLLDKNIGLENEAYIKLNFKRKKSADQYAA